MCVAPCCFGDCWLFCVARCLLFAMCCLLLCDVSCSLFAIYCFGVVVCCALFGSVCCSLRGVRCVFFVVVCCLLVVRCSVPVVVVRYLLLRVVCVRRCVLFVACCV